MTIKLIAIDLDGTLLQTDKTISQTNKDAILAAKEKGIKVVLTTGRPIKATEHYLEECQLKDAGDYCITYNGGLVQKTDTGEVLRQDALDHKDTLDIHALLSDLDLPMSAVGIDAIYEPAHPEGKPSLYREIQPLLEVKEDFNPADLPDIYKIVSARNVEEVDAAIKKFPADYFERFSVVKSQPILVEFMPKGIHKASGLEVLAQELGIEAENIMAIGDMDNDETMIKYAGTGVAMGNADPKIKDIAQFVTKTNDDHGVAYAIEKFVLN